MPTTRGASTSIMSSVEVLEYIDKKIDEFKTSIVEEVSNDLKKEVKSIMKLHLDSIEIRIYCICASATC